MEVQGKSQEEGDEGRAPPRPSVRLVESLLERSSEYRQDGQHLEGAATARRAIELARSMQDTPRHAAALRLLGVHLFRLGDYEAAAKTSQQAANLFEGLQDHAGRSDALATLTMSYNELGLHDEAMASVSDCLAEAQKAGDRSLLCWAYNRLGCVHDSMGNLEQADRFLLQALHLARELDDAEARFSALINLSENSLGLIKSHRRRGDTVAADLALQNGLRCARESFELVHDSGNLHREAIALANLGMLRGLAGEYEQAGPLLQQAEELAKAHGYRPLVLMALQYTAELLRTRGQRDAAIAKFHEVLRIAPEQVNRSMPPMVYLALSDIYKEAGQYREALQEYERFHDSERRNNSQVAEVRARMLMNRLELDNIRLEAERAHLEAELQKLRSAELEAEKVVLQARTVELDLHANQDQLTGLWNRRYVDSTMPRLFQEARAEGKPFSVAFADLDGFKRINDDYGHLTGDEVLKQIAAMLKAHCRPHDLIARLGGEEFLLAMVDTPLAGALVVCERARALIEQHAWSELHADLRVTISIGVCDAQRAASYEALFVCADARLYEAKRNGRNRVEPRA